MKASRTYIVIDGFTIRASVRALRNRGNGAGASNLDYGQLRDSLRGSRPKNLIQRISYFIAYEDLGDETPVKKLFDFMGHNGYDVVANPISKDDDFEVGFALATYATAFMPQYEELILVANSAKYVPMVDFIKRQGKRVLVFGNNGEIARTLVASSALMRAADEFHGLDDLIFMSERESTNAKSRP